MTKRPRTPKKVRYHHGDLRNALLRAALDLVSRRGVEGFSLREAARAVGVSPAAAYRHFQDKSALLAAIALEGLVRMATDMEETLARVPGAPGTAARAAAEFAALAEAYVEFAIAHPSHFRVMFGPWCEHPGREELPMEAFPNGRDPYQFLVDALDALVATGAISKDARAGAEIAAWSIVHGLASLLVEGALPLAPTERRGLSPAERRAAIAAVQRSALASLGAPIPADLLAAPAQAVAMPARRRGSPASPGSRRAGA